MEVKTESVETVQEEINLFKLGSILLRFWKTALAVTTTVFAGGAAATFLKTPEYESEMLILMYREASVPDVGGLQETENPKKKENLSTEIEILKSRSLVAKAISPPESSFDKLSVKEVIKNMSIRQVGDADVLIVSYQDTNPQRAQKVLEALSYTYVDYSIERQRSQATNAIQFIDEQLPKAQQALNATTSILRSFRERYGIVEPEAYAVQVSELKQSLVQQEQEVEIALSQTQRQLQELRQQLQEAGQQPQAALANSVLSQDPYYQNLANQLTQLESELALELTRFQDNHPAVESLQLKRNQIQNLLQKRSQSILGSASSQIDINQVVGYGETRQTLTNQLLALETGLAAQENQLEAIRKAQAEVAAQFQQIPQLQQVYTELQRQLEVRSQAVNNLLEKRQELQIAEAQEIAPWEILESPYLPEDPISPNIKLNLLLALLMGGLSGVGAAFLLEKLSQKVKQVEDLKQLTGLSLLGTIPRIRGHIVGARIEEKRPLSSHQQSAFTESLRSLAMNLRYLGAATNRIKVLAFTSAMPSEGKTTITYHLGAVLAELGQRVLVVDGNLRQPTLHLLAGLPNHGGLSTALTSDRPWYSLVQKVETQSLDLISSGPTPPNPVALLNSQKMKQLFDEWRQTYDYVLIDTPAVVGVADTQSVGSYVDGIIFVAGMECSTHDDITRSLEILRSNHCTLAGVVANFVSKKHGHTYSYGQSAGNPPQSEHEKSNVGLVRESW
ncbi:polysaccharide biosynthesis tyrosine autokinase [Moorena producens JHB]|uniref:Polysaccharide biosynthesis tyrosine autokinase n=1 Tax=Moorena producens (strain JHB) TaxID=1454205 RepID=A0A1D9FVG6_MOOP1|nr:polysaccharide biosynthesis tyrosine autokinase [Moorena producens]AOY79366.1 polysaccharide biosynthesis tyrosine autokinase [Moorena producens JHB]